MYGKNLKLVLMAMLLLVSKATFSQVTERERPKEWSQLVKGARFMDRFLPMKGNQLSSDTWGTSDVRPRYVDNGIEDRVWSYWGGNIRKGEDGKYHLMVCGWMEASPKGHMEWRNSWVFNTVSDNLTGPFKPINIIGKGHNRRCFRQKTADMFCMSSTAVMLRMISTENGNMENSTSMRAIVESSKDCPIFRLPNGKTVHM